MECYYCKGKLVRGTSSYYVKRHNYHFVVDEVPAWVCQQCGEPLFAEKEVERIQDIIRNMDAKVRVLAKAA